MKGKTFEYLVIEIDPNNRICFDGLFEIFDCWDQIVVHMSVELAAVVLYHLDWDGRWTCCPTFDIAIRNPIVPEWVSACFLFCGTL